MSESFTSEEQVLSGLWDNHLKTELVDKSPAEAIATMSSDPRVIHLPTLMGGQGREELFNFYAKHFLSQIPPDMEVVRVSRTVGQGRVVDELVLKLTHSVQIDWLLPGVPPTNKRLEFAMVIIVHVEGDKIAGENLYWDQASVLLQAGLITDQKLPIVGAEGARSLLDPSLPLNELMKRAPR